MILSQARRSSPVHHPLFIAEQQAETAALAVKGAGPGKGHGDDKQQIQVLFLCLDAKIAPSGNHLRQFAILRSVLLMDVHAAGLKQADFLAIPQHPILGPEGFLLY